ncbi:MAG: hypothetical protein JXK05_01010 [Campylobacterales bacterium]|nr:hypothetical protein [Campylobacterales bacterium]
MLKIMALPLLAATTLMAFHTAELNINDKDFEGSILFDMGQFNHTLMPDTTFFGLRYLKGSEDHSDLHKTEALVDASFLLQRPVGSSSGVVVGMGVKYVYLQIADEEFSALPLGLHLRYALPLGIGVPVYTGAQFYYSPQVLTFNEGKNFIEYRAFVDVEMIERGHIVAGYRNVDTNFDADDVNYNRSWFAGFRFEF